MSAAETESIVSCEECEKEPAVKQCNECEQVLCEHCVEALHRKGSRARHQISVLASVPSSSSSVAVVSSSADETGMEATDGEVAEANEPAIAEEKAVELSSDHEKKEVQSHLLL
jgi:hypothetical protein